MLYNNPKIIFIHVPKTAGSSVEHFFNRCPYLLERDGRIGQHHRLQDAYDLYGDLSEYKIFTIMRNTYDRVLSFYLMNYLHKSFVLQPNMYFRNRNYVPFPEYYSVASPQHTHLQDFFYYLNVNGELPEKLTILDFDNIEEEFTNFWTNDCGFEMPVPFPHNNMNVKATNELKTYLKSDPQFMKVVAERWKKEIEYFGYK
jgi:hypothetical protein